MSAHQYIEDEPRMANNPDPHNSFGLRRRVLERLRWTLNFVTYATEFARSSEHDLTFIIADDNDWPKHLYEAIGFQAIGWTWTFHRAVDLNS